MHAYQKRGISPKIRRRRFLEIKIFGTRRCSLIRFYYAPRGRDFSYFGLFSTLRVFCPKGLFGCVFCPKGLFGSDFGIVGNVAVF